MTTIAMKPRLIILLLIGIWTPFVLHLAGCGKKLPGERTTAAELNERMDVLDRMASDVMRTNRTGPPAISSALPDAIDFYKETPKWNPAPDTNDSRQIYFTNDYPSLATYDYTPTYYQFGDSSMPILTISKIVQTNDWVGTNLVVETPMRPIVTTNEYGWRITFEVGK